MGTFGSTEVGVRGGYFTENRNNGTPAQINATISRWGAATAHGLVGGGAWEAAADLSRGNYRQTFSAILGADRSGERLTSLQWVQPGGQGFSADWIREAGQFTGMVSGSARSSRATLDEQAFSFAGVLGPLNRTRARQNSFGVTFQGRFELSPSVTIDGGLRVEHSNTDNLGIADDDHGQNFVAPRIGASFRFTPDQTLRVTWLTGFRVPTINELYRSFRVGNTLTQANANLGPEKSWGPEVAYTVRQGRWSARAIFYATRLDGAIYNRTLTSTPALITRVRTNGDVRAIGSELELEARVTRIFSLTTSWALNNSTMTSGELDGKQVPQVPHVQGAIGLRADAGRFAGAFDFRVIGQQFDDDRNDFLLQHGSLADARGAWRVAKGVEVFGAIENAFNEDLDTGRTPIRTVGQPRIGRVGLEFQVLARKGVVPFASFLRRYLGNPPASPTAASRARVRVWGRGIFRRLRLALQRPPVRDDLRPIAVNLQPGQRVVDRMAVQESALRPEWHAHVEQSRLQRENLVQVLDIASGHLQHAQLHTPLQGIGREPLLPPRQTERHQQRADDDGVGHAVGRRGETGAVAIEPRHRLPERARRPIELRRDGVQQLGLFQLTEALLRRARAQNLEILLEQAWWRAAGDLVAVRLDRLDDRRIDVEIEPRREDDRAQHAHRVLEEPDLGIADRTNHSTPKILETVDIVDDRISADVVEERVDREITPEGIFLRRAERVVAVDHAIVGASPGQVGAFRQRLLGA